MTTLLQDSTSENPRFAIVVSSFNSDITDALLAGAKGAFSAAGLPAEALAIHHVPGAFELPFVCDQLAASGTFAAVLALGCVIRGDTPHFDFVPASAQKASKNPPAIVVYRLFLECSPQTPSPKPNTGRAPIPCKAVMLLPRTAK